MKNKKVNLKEGFVMVPEDYVVVEQTKTEQSNYAGIVTERYGKLPHCFLVFSEKPISNYTVEEENQMYAFLAELYPEVREVREQEVDAVYKQGVILNPDAWNAALRLALFPVCEVSDMEHLDFGTGIFRRED